MNPRHAKPKGKTKGLCYCVVLSFQGVTPLVVPKTSRGPSGSTAMGTPKSTPIEAASQVRRGSTIVQACCEPENYIHRKTKNSAGCIFIDITVEDEFTSSAGTQKGLDGLKGPDDTLIFTGPCTGGCKWAQFNDSRGETTVAQFNDSRGI